MNDFSPHKVLLFISFQNSNVFGAYFRCFLIAFATSLIRPFFNRSLSAFKDLTIFTAGRVHTGYIDCVTLTLMTAEEFDAVLKYSLNEFYEFVGKLNLHKFCFSR